MLVNHLTDFLTKHIADYGRKKYVLAVSGGMDSMLMLHLFKSMNVNVVVAHCNFNLRGQESQGDEEFVQQQCLEMEVPYHVKTFDLKVEKHHHHHEGTQLLARKLRYLWFEELRKSLGYDYLCTAHHQRDNAETLIYRFMNGAYPESMQGIKPIQGNIIRPMIYIPYTQLLFFVQKHNIQFRTDSSNLSQDYTRNKIRHTVLPALQQVFGDNYEDKMEGIASVYASYFDFIKQQAENLLQRKNLWYELNIEFLKHTRGNVALLYEALKNFGFNWLQCDQIGHQLTRAQGVVYENNDRTYNLYFTADVLQLVPVLKTFFFDAFRFVNEESKEISTPFGLISFSVVKKEALLEYSEDALYMDFALVQAQNSTIRSYENTDLFQPFGMKGRKLVRDYLKDIKLTPAEKQYQYVFCVDERVACILGKRIDDAFKITDKTERVLVIK